MLGLGIGSSGSDIIRLASLEEAEHVTVRGGSAIAARTPPLGIIGVWRGEAGVLLPKNAWFAKNALMNFTGELLHAPNG